jgi:copper oxidase (laccase) domain-containing protein
MARKGARISSIKAWIGPHISRSSFEVGQDVAARLETRYLAAASRFTEERDSALWPHSDSNKAFVDLSKIATTQLRAVGLSTDLIQNLMIDTFTSQEHASYRRDDKDSGRQISLIALHE